MLNKKSGIILWPKLFLAIYILVSGHEILGQTNCLDRFKNNVFQNISISNDILYGNNLTHDSTIQNLLLDFYEPFGDSLSHRPLILFIHGGGFIGGTKNDIKLATLCDRFAKKGYVTASIEYRVGVDTSTGNNFFNAALRAIHDAKAAVRFFRLKADSLGIDTSNIFIGGCSAGGVTALHVAYMDSTELYSHPLYDSTLLGVQGGIKGLSGNNGISSNVHGVINLWGAITDTSWINQNDVPVISIFGASDIVVPPNSGTHPSYPDISLHGGIAVHQKATQLGILSFMKSYNGLGHGHSAGGPHMDTTVQLITNYLCNILKPTVTNITQESTTYYDFYIMASNDKKHLQAIKLPVNFKNQKAIELYSLDGKRLGKWRTTKNTITVGDSLNLPNLFVLRIESQNKLFTKLISIH